MASRSDSNKILKKNDSKYGIKLFVFQINNSLMSRY